MPYANFFLLSLFSLALTLLLVSMDPTLYAQDLFGKSTDTIPPELEAAYGRGLEYLAKTQSIEGAWPSSVQYGTEPAVVGFAILAFLAHGDDPNSGPYAKVVQRGLDYILKQQNDDTGFIGTSMYNHGFSTLVLAEAFGVVDDPRIGPALKRAVDLIVHSQAGNPSGAWRYSPESQDADTTVTGSQLVALFAARNAGLPVPEEAIQKGIAFLKSCQCADGGFGYTGPDGSNCPRTAIATLILALDKEQKGAPCKLGSKFLIATVNQEETYQQYYLYYCAQALYQTSREGWKTWNSLNAKTLEAAQQQDGSWEGSNGPIFGTATSLLSLALNYGFLPIYER